VPSVTIKHIGCLLTGDASRPLRDADTLYVEDGVVRQIGGPAQDAELVIDARGSTVAPGLIDAHTHPSFGEYTPTQDATHWIRNYLHGGITSVVSAGELHVPGLPLDHPDPQLFKWLAILARRTYAAPGPWGARVYAGTPMVTPGMTERDFDDFQREGIRLVKFIFYPFKDAPAGEAESYVRWAHARGIRVKIHSGGVSRSGVSQMAGVEIMKRLRPDVVAHVNGGPIPMPLDEVLAVVDETACALELSSAGNYRTALRMIRRVLDRDELPRLVIGSDTPSGTGVLPRGMLRNVAFAASVCDVPPEQAVCFATGNVARTHDLPVGFVAEGKPADLVLLGKIQGSEGKDVLGAIACGNIPGVGMVLVNGRLRVWPRSEQTPPPEVLPAIERGHP
jgi:Amidohydrolase family